VYFSVAIHAYDLILASLILLAAMLGSIALTFVKVRLASPTNL
jgi:hypothetical protein